MTTVVDRFDQQAAAALGLNCEACCTRHCLFMHALKWSATEKKIARRAYQAALERALAAIMAEFKAKAAKATTPSDMWDIEDYLRRLRVEFDEMFDYRYSRLPFVFACLIRDGHLDEASLTGLSEEKLSIIRNLRSLNVSDGRRP